MAYLALLLPAFAQQFNATSSTPPPLTRERLEQAQPSTYQCQLIFVDLDQNQVWVACPGEHVFAPLRVVLILSAPDSIGPLDPGGRPQVEMRAAKEQVLVKLPHFDPVKNRRWKAWKKCTVAKLLLLQEGRQ